MEEIKEEEGLEGVQDEVINTLDLNKISNIIKTCCFLHNFHLCVDGVRSSGQIMGRGKNTRVSKTGDDPLSSEVFKKKETEWYIYKASLEVGEEDPLMIEPDIDGTAHNEFKMLLIEHFEIQRKMKLLHWATGFYASETELDTELHGINPKSIKVQK